MADAADQWRAIAYPVRAIPGQMGLRPHSVEVLHGTWTGEYTGRGIGIGDRTKITEAGGQNPKVHWLNDEQLALGNLGQGAVQIGPITPDFGAGGTPLSAIRVAVRAGETVHVVIRGPMHPDGAKYAMTRVDLEKAVHWTIRAEPVSDVVP